MNYYLFETHAFVEGAASLGTKTSYKYRKYLYTEVQTPYSIILMGS